MAASSILPFEISCHLSLCSSGCTSRFHVHCVGKTTLLRDIVRLLADDFGKRVLVVDTSNEIGGDGKVPHACLGKARRMTPPDQARQHEVMLEAVQNHTPEVQNQALLCFKWALHCTHNCVTWSECM